jgi:hypothetical protein
MMINFESFLAARGNFVKVSFQTEKKPAAAHKGNTLQKFTTGVFRAGINFANLGSVKDAIANGERGAVQPLPWGEWQQFPYVIKHKESFYLRLYPAKNAKVETTYLVNGQITTKADFDSYLTPSDAKSPDKFECFTVKCENVIALCDDITHEEILEAI